MCILFPVYPVCHGHGFDESSALRKPILGLVILPSFLSAEAQRTLIKSILTKQARSPNETNLDTHYQLPANGLWPGWERTCRAQRDEETEFEEEKILRKAPSSSPANTSGTRRTLIDNPAVTPTNFAEISAQPKQPSPPSISTEPSTPSKLLYKLRWANVGHSYHWGTKTYDFGREHVHIHPDIKEVCQRAVRAVDWNVVFGAGRASDSEEHQGDVEDDEGWGERGPDWQGWHDTYGAACFCPKVPAH